MTKLKRKILDGDVRLMSDEELTDVANGCNDALAMRYSLYEAENANIRLELYFLEHKYGFQVLSDRELSDLMTDTMLEYTMRCEEAMA